MCSTKRHIGTFKCFFFFFMTCFHSCFQQDSGCTNYCGISTLSCDLGVSPPKDSTSLQRVWSSLRPRPVSVVRHGDLSWWFSRFNPKLLNYFHSQFQLQVTSSLLYLYPSPPPQNTLPPSAVPNRQPLRAFPSGRCRPHVLLHLASLRRRGAVTDLTVRWRNAATTHRHGRLGRSRLDRTTTRMTSRDQQLG